VQTPHHISASWPEPAGSSPDGGTSQRFKHRATFQAIKQFKYWSVHPTPKAGAVSPIVVGPIRGIIAAVITGLIAYFAAVQGVGISEE
jgi:hypothetical protein